LSARQAFDRQWNDGGVWEIEFMDSAVNGVNLNGSGNIKSSLLKAEAQSARSSE
jgi:hypothetical protein